MGDLAADTAVSKDGDGRYTATLSRDWEIWGPNGGYLASVALRAAAAASAQPRPATLSCHFLAVADFGPVSLEVVPLRTARRAESLRVSLAQGERRILEALAWMVTPGDGLVHDAGAPAEVDGPEGVPSIQERLGLDAPEAPFPFWSNLESRPVDWIEDWDNRPGGEHRSRDWYRYTPRATFENEPAVDAARSLILLDTMGWPAAVRGHPGGEVGFVAPTLDVNVQFHRAAPRSEWLLVEGTSPLAEDGLVGFASRVWSADRQLLASASGQLLCRPVPGGN